MEGVGGRLGRSSTRYGPAAVFTGPVRKWKKKWVVHVPPSTAASNNHSQSQRLTNATTNASHLLLYKWTPTTVSLNNDDKIAGKEHTPPPPTEDPPRRKFKYIPIAVLEEQHINDEAAYKVEDEASNSNTKVELQHDKPNINDVPMEESQDNDRAMRQDLNESTSDLSLNLNALDDDDVEAGSKAVHIRGGRRKG